MFEQGHDPGGSRVTEAAATVEISASWRELPAGPELMIALASLPLAGYGSTELLEVLSGWERAAGWLAAQQARAMSLAEARLTEDAVQYEEEVGGRVSWNAVDRQVETEISTALRWTSRYTLDRIRIATVLAHRLPAVSDALAAGQISYRHAEVFCEETDVLTEEQAQRVADRVLPDASTLTTIGLRKRLRKACLQLVPDSGNERAAKAITERSVTIRPATDGLAILQAIGPAEAIYGIFRRLDDAAGKAPADDDRTRTARRFDALTSAVLTSSDLLQHCPVRPTIPALVQITMDVETLLGLRNNPAEVHGYGPLPATLARALAVDADWQRFIHDPLTGAPADLGRTQRHPNGEIRRWIIARDRTCLFPACFRPAARCEPDHNPAWDDGGGTNKDTLTQLCPKHHKVRHHGWHYQRHPDRITWNSPHQQIYERYFTEADLVDPLPDDPPSGHSPSGDPAPPPPDAGRLATTNTPLEDPTPGSTASAPSTVGNSDCEEEFDDAIWFADDEDQRITSFLPKTRRGHLPDNIDPRIVETFRLDERPDWRYDADGALQPRTPKQQQQIVDTEARRHYDDDLLPRGTIPADSPLGRTLLNRARTRAVKNTAAQKAATRDAFPDEPPF
jgi:hypothetical protein